jgi:trehalose/maltose hydrolase-like predicted phosphorylase
VGRAMASFMRSDNWHITETEWHPEALHHKETVFTIGNGYLGTRGTFEEGSPGDQPATLVHGVFDDVPLVRTELANAPNWLPFVLFVDGERFRMDRGTVCDYRRDLDLGTGVLARTLRWRSPAGHTVDLEVERFASLANSHLLAIRYRVTALDFVGVLEFRAGLDGHVDNAGWVHWRLVDQGTVGEQGVYLHVRTRSSGIELCEACHLAVSGRGDVAYSCLDCDANPTVRARLTVQPGEQVTAEKLVVLFTSRDAADVDRASADIMPARCRRSIDRASAGETRFFYAMGHRQNLVSAAAISGLEAAAAQGYQNLRAASEEAWRSEWEACNVSIEGDDAADLALRYSLFQLLIAAPRQDEADKLHPWVSIPAKSLSGFGYRGHVFWDTDIFIVPFFTFTRPEIARNLLAYRFHTLPGARRKAQESGYEGAMFAWESAGSGEETTPRWVPGPDGELVRIWSGDIEHHITADVAYAVVQYWRVTGDDVFMCEHGAEIVLDTARFWGSRVEWNASQGSYEITDVVGPDEYHEHVDNNVFTNGMARWNLEAALEVLAWLRREYPEKAAELEERLDLTAERLAHWADVIGCMYTGYDPQTDLMEQFEGFFDLEDVDLAAYEPRSVSMQFLLGLEEVQRYQVVKQPDALMLLFLLGESVETRFFTRNLVSDEWRHPYGGDTLRVNWDYYTPRTDLTYGSSLGPPIQALLAARLGEQEMAYEHFMHAAWTDLRDVRGNAADGIHAATAGGLWQALAFGFAGLRVVGGGWRPSAGYEVTPQLPAHWKRLSFSFIYRGERIALTLPAQNASAGIGRASGEG